MMFVFTLNKSTISTYKYKTEAFVSVCLGQVDMTILFMYLLYVFYV